MLFEFTLFTAFIAATGFITKVYLKEMRAVGERVQERLDAGKVLPESSPQDSHSGAIGGWRCYIPRGENFSVWLKPAGAGKIWVHCCKGTDTPVVTNNLGDGFFRHSCGGFVGVRLTIASPTASKKSEEKSTDEYYNRFRF